MKTLGIIAGNRQFPQLLARHARARGVDRVVAVAFHGETDPVIESMVDDVIWVHIGQLGKLIGFFRKNEVDDVVMAGQLDPRHVVKQLRPDLRMIKMMALLRDRRTDSVLKAVIKEIEQAGLHVGSATLYMDDCLITHGTIHCRKPTRQEQDDISFGISIAKTVAELDIGQTVVVKNKAVVAVEAMEGTDQTMRRAGTLAGKGNVVVKVCRPTQDFRFDVPVIGPQTIQVAGECNIGCLAIEESKTFVFEQEQVETLLKKAKICLHVF